MEGLLRSIILDILTQCPGLAPVAAPWRWQSHQLGAITLSAWTNNELLNTFERLLLNTQERIKICFFIDGLDEFEGSDTARENVILLLKRAARMSHVKVCLSSRPWLIFEDAFGGQPSLLLQHLTYQDIKNFVHSELVENQKFARLRDRDELGCSSLVLGITDKAKGVFL